MKLISILLEESKKPKVIIMAGGAGAGKSYVIEKLGLESLPVYNPDKYVENPESSMYNNLSAASKQTEKDVEQAVESGETFIWDTTASNPKKVLDLLSKGYDVFMVMVYTHPIISFISNFSRKRRIPKAAVFSTWVKVYELVDEYKDLLGDNLRIFVNLRDGKYSKYVEEFNEAAEKGVEGVTEYLKSFMEKYGGEEAYSSTFRSKYKLPTEEAKQSFEEETKNLTFDRGDESLLKQLKKYWFQTYEKKGTGPGDKKLEKKINSILSSREKRKESERGVLSKIANMLTDSTFQELLKHSSIEEISKNIQRFLK